MAKKMSDLQAATSIGGQDLTEISQYVSPGVYRSRKVTGSQSFQQPWIDINRYGFLNQTETTISFNGTNTFTLAPTGTTWSYYRAGIKYTITGSKTKVLATPMVDGTVYYIYIDATDGTLTSSTIAWTLNDTKMLVATVFWHSALTPQYILVEERHTCLVDRAWHREHHLSTGTQITSGGTPSGYVLNSANNADKTFAISSANLFDEDILIALSLFTDPDGTIGAYYNFYRTSTTTWAWLLLDMPFKAGGAGSPPSYASPYTYIEYDAAGSTTDSQNNRWVNTYLVGTSAVVNSEATPGVSTSPFRFIIVQGRGSYTSSTLAYGESFTSFDMTGFPFTEAIAFYQLTWNTSGMANTVKGRCVLNRVQRISSNVISTSTISTANHNTLAGLQGGDINDYVHLTTAQANGLVYGNVNVVSTSTLLDSTHAVVIVTNGSTINLPTAIGISGKRYTVVATSVSSVLLDTTSGQTISGDPNYTLSSQWQSVTIVSDGSNWVRI